MLLALTLFLTQTAESPRDQEVVITSCARDAAAKANAGCWRSR